MRRSIALIVPLLATAVLVPLRAIEPDRDFSGKWILDASASNTRSLGQIEPSLSVMQGEVGILCSAGGVQWSYALDGSETRKRVGEETRNAVVKWEGSALLVNTLVAGPSQYTVMDRWRLSRDRNTLTIARQIVRASGENEGTLVFHREGTMTLVPPEAPQPPQQTQQPADMPRPLAKRTAPGIAPDITVPSGTRVLLELVGKVSTKTAKEGDRVYLRTAAPVAVEGRVVIPRASDVAGTITRAKKAGTVAGKGELFLRFDSLILPNGVSRDFHARAPGEEGKVDGETKPADPRTVMEGAGLGVGIGAIAARLPGAAVGGGIGALAGVLMSRDRNVVLPAGTHVEMVLDRDLVFRPDEISGLRY